MAVQWLQAEEGDVTPQDTRLFLQLMDREEKLLDQNAARQHNRPDEEPKEAKNKPNYRALTEQELRQFLALLAKLRGTDDAESSGAAA
ncbi:MAG: hypothetical protein F4Y42_14665 [Caldilineaceae bacterium SB0664_bin_27]|uniref:Uncharacterized protein n=1 Tax=Caldilineaceae bacterium SB0664_bin_27 TaxID=2605260 RepID=A0A6B0YW92_9CHLR|nr:hypothetical protein [Caldilineaceae bacterium SB0664_bin_27]